MTINTTQSTQTSTTTVVAAQYTIEKASTESIRDDVFALRYRAYREVGLIDSNPERRFSDEFDMLPNCMPYLVRRDGEPVASIRAMNVVHEPHPAFDRFAGRHTPCLVTYARDIQSALGPDASFVESSRFVTLDHEDKTHMRAQMLLFRAIIANALVHDLDHVLTFVRRKHVLFYRKLMGMRRISPPRRPPHLLDDYYLMAALFETKYPYMCSQDPRAEVGPEEAAALAM